MTKTRTFTPSHWRGLPADPITGSVHSLGGVPMVAHKRDAHWVLSEPISGKCLQTFERFRTPALVRALALIEIAGGPCALLSAMAGLAPRLKARQLQDTQFAYGAGGPLDAPDLICTGVTKYARYGSGASELPNTYQVEVPR